MNKIHIALRNEWITWKQMFAFDPFRVVFMWFSLFFSVAVFIWIANAL